MSVYRNNTEALAQYLQSMVKLEELQKMTEDLDKELEDSQRLLSEIKTIFYNVPAPNNRTQQNIEIRPEQLAQFLVADAPRLLMPDMAEAIDVDIDNILTGLKTYAEDLKKSITVPHHLNSHHERSNRIMKNVDLKQYAHSLDQLSKRLAIVNQNKINEGNNRNAELEAKLTQLCDDVNSFTQMVETKTKLSETNKNWTPNEPDNATVLLYDSLINKLIQSINEVTYLLKSRN